jgi:hypothetical protein
MATVFKTLANSDISLTRTLLNEAIPITGTVVSGTYGDTNIKNYTHGMFQSVYDYPFQSSSANHIFDITYGYSPALSSSLNTMNAKKLNMYNQMAQVLVGYDQTGSIRRFDRDGDFTVVTDSMDSCVFINYSRLLTKDEIRKQTYSLTLLSGATELTVHDHGAQTEYRVNSPAGEFAMLYTGSQALTGSGVGLIYYQAGVVVLTASSLLFSASSPSMLPEPTFSGSSISGTADEVRQAWVNNSFQNTTELNSTIYFCRAANSQFNYSSNKTYLSQSQIRVKGQDVAMPPVSYITSVGLYSSNNELLAVAKLSEPIKKDPSTELIFRVRLDY